MTARKYPVDEVMRESGVRPVYTSSDVAKMLGITKTGLAKMVREGRCLDENGDPFVPAFDGYKYVWEFEDVKCAAVSAYNARSIDMDRLKRILRKLLKDRGEISGKY